MLWIEVFVILVLVGGFIASIVSAAHDYKKMKHSENILTGLLNDRCRNNKPSDKRV